ncbi:hypothetical protein AMTR_s00026p00081160 [Amborella trichopoda]|uniref:Uncharacterized protein n=1 Tax=Amborella trichopoda TaxID=13333 RepID=W1PSW3_AMBTC|nr:hypothetical protein AMTR_s00026p00081160 [Amborella trichopoda]
MDADIALVVPEPVAIIMSTPLVEVNFSLGPLVSGEALRGESDVCELSGARLTSVDDLLTQHQGLMADYARKQVALISHQTDLKDCGVVGIAELRTMREEIAKMNTQYYELEGWDKES